MYHPAFFSAFGILGLAFDKKKKRDLHSLSQEGKGKNNLFKFLDIVYSFLVQQLRGMFKKKNK